MKKRFTALLLLALPILCFAKTYTFGVQLTDWAGLPVEQQVPSYENFLSQLSSNTGDTFKLKQFDSRQALAEALANGDVDFAYIKPMTYLLAKEKNSDIKPLVLTVDHSDNGEVRKTYAAYIVTRTDNPALSVSGLKGKPFGFTDKYAAGSYAYMVAYLKNQNIDVATYFSEIKFYETSHALMQAIAKGEVEGGSVFDEGFEHNNPDGKFKVITRIQDVPNPLIAASADVSDDVATKMKQALLESKPLGMSFSGLAGIPPHFYDQAQVVYNEVYGEENAEAKKTSEHTDKD